MDKLWNYITPGYHGVNKIEMYQQGYDKFIKNNEIGLSENKIMNILGKSEQRPSKLEVFTFLKEALENNHSVAF